MVQVTSKMPLNICLMFSKVIMNVLAMFLTDTPPRQLSVVLKGGASFSAKALKMGLLSLFEESQAANLLTQKL